MTIELACVATGKYHDKMLHNLVSNSGGRINLAFHLGHINADIKASSLSSMNTRKGRKGHLMDDQEWKGSNQALLSDPRFTEMMEEFVDHLHRRSDAFFFNSHNLRSVQDYFDYYQILTDVIAERLIELGVTHCLFFNVPHLGFDTALYHVAKSLGLKTMMVTQSIFPGRYCSMESVSEYGCFDIPSAAHSPHSIAKGEPQELFYMKGIKQHEEAGGRISAKALGNLAKFLVLKRPMDALNPAYLVRTLRRMQNIYGKLPKWRDPFARFFHENDLAYFDHIAQYEKTPIDLDQRFVYFPLQMQPEMTTSALGGGYRDQARAIEDLASILPSGVKIYVKENPKQGAYMRGPMFFHRLKRIACVEILPSFANTHALSDKAELVATITGTGGWEAICKGKPALVFGNTWYQTLPGVSKFCPDLDYQTLIEPEIDHAALEQAAGNLISSMHPGVVERHYAKLVDEFDEEANAKRVADMLEGLLTGSVMPLFRAEQ